MSDHPSPLSAIVQGKLPAAARSEDLLTSIVLGSLAWLDDGRALVEFLKKSTANPHWSDATELESLEFWPWWDQSDIVRGAEPDAVVLIRAKDGRRWLVVIEAKHGAGKSGHGEQDQLKRQYLNGRAIVPQGVTFGGVVYLTSHVAPPRGDLAASRRELEAVNIPVPKLYWLSWRDVHPLLEAMQLDGLEAALARDLVASLERMGLLGTWSWPAGWATPSFNFHDPLQLDIPPPAPRWTFDEVAPGFSPWSTPRWTFDGGQDA